MRPLSGSGAIFLSAGLPDPSRTDKFICEGDSSAITAAVSALLYVTIGRRRLIWGGQPAITAMVVAYAASTGIPFEPWMTLYQSRHFAGRYPEANRKVKNVRLTEDRGSEAASLNAMRETMLSENHFDAAVFIGGMKGLLEEFEGLDKDVRRIPLASTGGAASALSRDRRSYALDERFGLDYVALLHEALEIDRNEQRYPSPGLQPFGIEDRIRKPKPN